MKVKTLFLKMIVLFLIKSVMLTACGTNTVPAASTLTRMSSITEQAIATNTKVSAAISTFTQQPTSTPAISNKFRWEQVYDNSKTLKD